MLELRSALAGASPYRSPMLAIAERSGFALVLAAGLDPSFEKKLAEAVGPLPAAVGIAVEHAARTVMRVGPSHFWIVGPEAEGLSDELGGSGALTSLSHSRTRIAIEGGPARNVLAKLVPIDLDPAAFGPGRFAMTGLHHTPVTLHCTGEESFDLYVMRSFALDLWEVVTDAALEFAAP
jgi:sarcosine oxidase subunit gamma